MKEFVWNELHYALDDGLNRFSIISTYPKLPYEYSPRVLDIWKNDFLRDQSMNKQLDIRIFFHSREELYEVYIYLLNSGWDDIIVKDINDDIEDPHYYLRKVLAKRRWFNISDIVQKRSGYPSSVDSIDWETAIPGYTELDLYASKTSFAYIDVRVNFKNIEKFIQDIKGLRALGYKNLWRYPGEKQLEIKDILVI